METFGRTGTILQNDCIEELIVNNDVFILLQVNAAIDCELTVRLW